MSEASQPDLCYLFVDEAGAPEIFDRKGRNNIGNEGCSHYFMLGMLEVDEPEKLAEAFKELREQLMRDPYFASAESFKPERKKTALLLHAKDDLPEVRVKVWTAMSVREESHFLWSSRILPSTRRGNDSRGGQDWG